MKKNALVWFRKNLRVDDNTTLFRAIKENDHVIACYCLDPLWFVENSFGFRKIEKYRAKFLLESLQQLKTNLEQVNITLLVFYKSAEDIIPDIVEKYTISTLYTQKEWTAEEVKSIDNLKQHLKDTIEIKEEYDQFLYHPEDIPFSIDKIPDVFTAFRKKVEKYGSIRSSVSIEKCTTDNRIDNPTRIPTLEELGFTDFIVDQRSAFPFMGGERNAKDRIEAYFWNTKGVSQYKKTRNGLLGTEYSSKLSAWLANGSISARTIYHQVCTYEKEIEKNQSTYWLIFELIWRDYFKYISLKHGNAIFKIDGILHKHYEWCTDPDTIKKWIDGETTEPFVNANMLELKNTGWMSNRGRQNVASYFAKELKLDWRIGAAYFESMLVDYDVHSNYGNWLYVSGVGNDPRDRKFNVKLQAERYDRNNAYQNLWLQPTLF